MEMLRNEAPLKYMYKCIKDKGDYVKGEVFCSLPFDDKKHFVQVGTFRQAFVGDMQEKINEDMKMDVMRHYAETVSNFTSQLIVHVPYYIKADYSLKGFWQHIKDVWKEKKEKREDRVLDELLYGKREPVDEKRSLSSLEDYLFSTREY